MPDVSNKIILLESLGGKEAKIASYVAQLEQLGVFSKCLGIVVGEHTEAEEKRGIRQNRNLISTDWIKI